MWGYGPMSMIGFGFGWFFQLIFLIIIIWAIFALFRHGRHSEDCCGKNYHMKNKENESHIDILKNRYAKGEITKEEFEKIKKDLT